MKKIRNVITLLFLVVFLLCGCDENGQPIDGALVPYSAGHHTVEVTM